MREQHGRTRTLFFPNFITGGYVLRKIFFTFSAYADAHFQSESGGGGSLNNFRSGSEFFWWSVLCVWDLQRAGSVDKIVYKLRKRRATRATPNQAWNTTKLKFRHLHLQKLLEKLIMFFKLIVKSCAVDATSERADIDGLVFHYLGIEQ